MLLHELIDLRLIKDGIILTLVPDAIGITGPNRKELAGVTLIGAASPQPILICRDLILHLLMRDAELTEHGPLSRW